MNRVSRLLPRQPALRVYALITLVEYAGTSLFLAGSAVFFIRIVGLRAAQVGGGLSLAALLGVVTAVPSGILSDRYGYRKVLLCSYVLRVPLFISYLLVHSEVSFLLVVCAIGLADNAGRAVRPAYIAVLADKNDRMAFIAYSRSVTNAGFAVGSLAAGIALAINTRVSVESLVVGNALTFVTAAILLTRLPARPRSAHAHPASGITKVVRNRPYLTLALLIGMLSVCSEFFTVGLPLWIVSRTSAPHWTLSAVLLVSTLLALALVLPLSRRSTTLTGAARASLCAGVVLFAGCAIMARSGGLGPLGATTVILVGVVLLTFGELYTSASSWGLSFALSEEGHHGAYLGLWSFATQLMQALAPAVMGVVLVGERFAGWLWFGTFFLITGALIVPVTSWAGPVPDQ